jgi:hypothetical protein
MALYKDVRVQGLGRIRNDASRGVELCPGSRGRRHRQVAGLFLLLIRLFTCLEKSDSSPTGSEMDQIEDVAWPFSGDRGSFSNLIRRVGSADRSIYVRGTD